MAAKPTMQIDNLPDLFIRGDRFIADVGIDGVPDFAFTPSVGIACAVALQRLFAEWQKSAVPVSTLKKRKR